MPRICITVPNKTPQPYRFPTDTEVVKIGRSAANDVVIEHGSVSSHHCEMRRVKGGFILADLDSTNGIHLDEQEMEIIDLKDGLDAEVGDVLFNYQLKEEEAEELSQEKFKSRQKKKKPSPSSKATAGPPKPPPPTPVTPSFQPQPDTSTRDFAIFAVCAALALFAFYLGMNGEYRSSFPKEERLGKSLWNDKIMDNEEK